ncbi:MAG: arabinooligosaccharide transport system permease protein [Thermomicrobiales bacterium]|jgi:ABC-type sugar transport system permease subunit|nr:arabinooligosaccharide transport system permease protein [Thermomicrobiales bacterium]MEA2528579.1 arabinooligosaccharide transport system permease protein [Thermomicrobiales bacterium]
MAHQLSQGGAAVAAPAAVATRRSRAPGTRAMTPYLFLAPFFIVYGIFLLYPVVDAFRLSFFEQTGISTPKFIGLDNYRALFTDERYLKALRNTTLYALASVCILSPLALAVALAVRSFIVPSPNLQSFYRAAFFLPYITSFVVIALMFGLVFDTNYGLLNSFLDSVGLPTPNWLRSERLALPSIILVAIWTFLGLNSLYFLAGLQNIPDDLSEAAFLDGATRSQVFWHVTLPLLRPTILFVLVQATIFSFQIFEIPFLLTRGGPSDASLTLAIYLYDVGFQQFEQGYASAIGYSLAVISMVLAGIQLLLFRAFADD